MRSVSGWCMLGALGVVTAACFNTTRNTKVAPGATNPQPVYTCQPRGGGCRANSDCCSQWCLNSTCVQPQQP
jgi:hypothetical protein